MSPADPAPSPRWPTAVILAGGASRRMGRDKAALRVAGLGLLARLTSGLAPHFESIVISAARGRGEVVSEMLEEIEPSRGGRSPHWRIVEDHREDRGPCEGLLRALEEVRGDSPVYLTAVDQPYFQVDLIAHLIERSREGRGAMPRHEGRLQPTVAAYHSDLVEDLRPMLEEGSGSLMQIGSFAGVEIVDPLPESTDPRVFLNLNRPEDLARFLERVEKGAWPESPDLPSSPREGGVDTVPGLP